MRQRKSKIKIIYFFLHNKKEKGREGKREEKKYLKFAVDKTF